MHLFSQNTPSQMFDRVPNTPMFIIEYFYTQLNSSREIVENISQQEKSHERHGRILFSKAFHLTAFLSNTPVCLYGFSLLGQRERKKIFFLNICEQEILIFVFVVICCYFFWNQKKESLVTKLAQLMLDGGPVQIINSNTMGVRSLFSRQYRILYSTNLMNWLNYNFTSIWLSTKIRISYYFLEQQYYYLSTHLMSLVSFYTP